MKLHESPSKDVPANGPEKRNSCGSVLIKRCKMMSGSALKKESGGSDPASVVSRFSEIVAFVQAET